MEGFQNFNTGNFDPNSLANQTSSVIEFIAVLDVSPSIESFEDSMNNALEELFMKELKNSHRKDDIVIKAITFCEDVEHKSGFMPITNLPNDYLHIKNTGRGTALYSAVRQALEHAIQYRTDLEDQGVDVRTNICIITDGADNSSDLGDVKAIQKIIADLRTNEAWSNSFTITFIGVGNDSTFRRACIEMGLDPAKCLVTIGSTAKEIRSIMGVVSQSVSSSASAAAINF